MNCKECRHWFVNPNIVIPGEPTEGKCLVSEIKTQSYHVCNAWELSQIAEWKDENEKLTARIAELEAAQRWHVVGDGDLPIVGKSIMFYDSSSEEIYRGVYTASHHWLANYFSEKCETVTHWMPLPARPEVQE